MLAKLFERIEQLLTENKRKRKIVLFSIFLLNFGVIYFFNLSNIQFIRKVNPENELLSGYSLLNNSTIYSVDNMYYLPQAIHFVQGNGLFIELGDTTSAIRRTPGYSLFFATHLLIFGEENVFKVISFTQMILFASSAILIFGTCVCVGLGYTTGILAAFLHTFNLFTGIFTSYTLTESLSPFLVCLSIFCFVYSLKNNSTLWFFITGIVLSATFLTRPLMGIILPCFALFFVFKRYGQWKALFLQGFILLIGLSIVWLPWIIRNYQLTNQVIFLEKISFNDPMDYGSGHIAFRDWVSCWTNPANQHLESIANRFKHEAKYGTLPSRFIDDYVAELPEKAFIANTKEEIRKGLTLLFYCYQFKYDNNIKTAKDRYNLACELETARHFKAMQHRYITENPIHHYIITPFLTLIDLIWQSGSFAMAVLNPPYKLDGSALFIKVVLFVLQVMIWVSIVYILFDRKIRNKLGYLIVLPYAILLCLLLFWSRHVEARYIVPLYPLGFIALAVCLHTLLSRVSAYSKILYRK
jgi:hypothetical protein